MLTFRSRTLLLVERFLPTQPGEDLAFGCFLPEDLPGFKVPERKHDLDWLLAFFDFCHIIEPPAIQTEI